MLECVSKVTPELYKFCYLAYNDHSTLQFGEFCLTSQEGYQQGDPLGGLLFCLVIHPVLHSTTSLLTIGFMDVITLEATHKDVLKDVLEMKESKLVYILTRLNEKQ